MRWKYKFGQLPDISIRTEQTIRLSGLLIPVMVIAYGLMIHFGVVPNTHMISFGFFIAIASIWSVVALYQFLIPPPSLANEAARLIVYHALSLAFLLGVSGVDMPFIPGYIMLLFASYTYFKQTGLNLSLLVLTAAAVGDALMHMDDFDHIMAVTLAYIATLSVAYIAGAINTSLEIDRKELSRSQAEEILQRDRMITLVNNLSDAVMSTDSHGMVQVYNAACLDILDTNHGLQGQSIDTLLHLRDSNNKPFHLVPAMRGSTIATTRDDLKVVNGEDTMRLSVSVSPIRATDNKNKQIIDGYIIMIRDITKQKSLEEERDEFISVVSHELRTPITIAEGSLSNVQLMMTRPDIPRATLADNVKMSHDQVVFLAKMVNDLSTLSRAERGVADAPEDIDLDSTIQAMYAEYAPQAAKKGLGFDLDLDPRLGTITASPLYFKELLQNFITNAIKYTKEGKVTVSVHKHDNDVTFEVKDTGIGISRSDQKRIFEKFFRSEDYRTRETGGTGLGLYVAVKLAKKLGTRIDMTSRINHGSTFGFTMKCADSSPQIPDTSAKASA